MRPNDATLPRFAPLHSWGPNGRCRRSAIGLALVTGLAVLAGDCVRRVAVDGGSMAPTLHDGDRLLVLSRPWPLPARPRVGDIVAVGDPRLPSRSLVKRVASIDPSSRTVGVLGDAPDVSTDSRHFGPVPMASIIGRVVHRYAPAGRSGPVRRSTEYHRV